MCECTQICEGQEGPGSRGGDHETHGAGPRKDGVNERDERGERGRERSDDREESDEFRGLRFQSAGGEERNGRRNQREYEICRVYTLILRQNLTFVVALKQFFQPVDGPFPSFLGATHSN